MAGHLELLPAVDVQDGRAVQLVQGIDGSARPFGDPLDAALNWRDRGAAWIHLVDLDAAFGRGHNRAVLARIVARLDIPVQMSGGIGDEETLSAALAAGCRRAVVATAALNRSAWVAEVIAEHGERIAVGLDVRGRTLAARGSVDRDGGQDLDGVIGRLDAAGCRRYVVTDVDKDGMLDGPNVGLLRHVCALTDRPVVASGGVTELGDIEALGHLTDVGLEGVVIGTALHEGRFTLEDALASTRPGGPG